MIHFDNIHIAPTPVSRPHESRRNAKSKALRAWRDGRLSELVVTTAGGHLVAVADVNWRSLPRTGGPSGKRRTKGRVVNLSLRGDALLDLVTDTRKTIGLPRLSSAAMVCEALELYVTTLQNEYLTKRSRNTK